MAIPVCDITGDIKIRTRLMVAAIATPSPVAMPGHGRAAREALPACRFRQAQPSEHRTFPRSSRPAGPRVGSRTSARTMWDPTDHPPPPRGRDPTCAPGHRGSGSASTCTHPADSLCRIRRPPSARRRSVAIAPGDRLAVGPASGSRDATQVRHGNRSRARALRAHPTLRTGSDDPTCHAPIERPCRTVGRPRDAARLPRHRPLAGTCRVSSTGQHSAPC